MHNIIQQASQQTRHMDNLMRAILNNRDTEQAASALATTPAKTVPKAGTITAKQIDAILNLAKAKQRSLPSNITRWSKWFASKYISFLISLPFPYRETPRFCSETDMLFAATHARRREYYWNDGMTHPFNQGERSETCELREQGGQNDSANDTSR